MRERVPPLKTRNKGTKSGRLVQVFRVLRGGTRSRMVFLEVFARGTLITAHDNIENFIMEANM